MTRPRLAIVTASTDTELYGDDILLPALHAAGVDTILVPWRSPLGRGDADAALIRTPWDYIEDRDGFLAWCAATAAAMPLANPLEVLRWNTDKTYLRDFERAGVSVVPTRWVEPGDRLDGEVDWPRFVVKPAVSAGGRSSASYDAGHIDAAREHVVSITTRGITAMVQPHIASIDDNGEVGTYVFAGLVTHAVHKGPLLKTGVPRVDDRSLGADQASARADVSDELAAFARQVVAAVSKDLGEVLYARVDAVTDDHGKPMLLELELVEPYLFLEHTPEAAPTVAAALAAWLARQLPNDP